MGYPQDLPFGVNLNTSQPPTARAKGITCTATTGFHCLPASAVNANYLPPVGRMGSGRARVLGIPVRGNFGFLTPSATSAFIAHDGGAPWRCRKEPRQLRIQASKLAITIRKGRFFA